MHATADRARKLPGKSPPTPQVSAQPAVSAHRPGATASGLTGIHWTKCVTRRCQLAILIYQVLRQVSWSVNLAISCPSLPLMLDSNGFKDRSERGSSLPESTVRMAPMPMPPPEIGPSRQPRSSQLSLFKDTPIIRAPARVPIAPHHGPRIPTD